MLKYNSATYEVDIDQLNSMLTWAYLLGRENENREERGIPLLNHEEEMKKYLTNLRNSV